MKKVNTLILWTVELGTGEAENVPNHIIMGFQQRNKLNDRTVSKDTF